MKRKKSVLISLLSVLCLSGCTGYDKDAYADGVSYHITSSGKTAFVSEAEADLTQENPQVIIPEKINQAKVKKLGGFFGTGVPAPFTVIAGSGHSYETYNPYNGEFGRRVILKDVPVSVHIPKTIEEVTYVSGGGCYGTVNENGELLFLRPVIMIDCDPDNPDYYSEDGILYSKEENSAVIDGRAEAEEFQPTLAEKLKGKYVKENEEDSEVIEFFTEFERVYSHTNWYMEDCEYLYSAAEYQPVDPEVLRSTEADYLDASAREFSSFTMAGQYTETDFPYYRLEPREDSIVITALDENREPVMDSGVELKRDMTAESQFPDDFSEWGMLYEEGENPVMSFGTAPGSPASSQRESDAVRMRVYRDGIITVEEKDSETPLILRGVLGAVYTGNGMDRDLVFVLTAAGGTREPYFGRVRFEQKSGDTFILHRIDGYEAWPLIPEGEEECTYH